MPRLGHDVAPSQRAQFFSAEVAASGFSPVVGFSTVLGATPLVPVPTASDTFAQTIGGSLAALSSLTATTLYSGAGIPSYESGALSAAIELRDNVGALVANVKTAIKGVSGALTEKVKAVVSEIAQAVQSKIAPILGRMIEATPVVRQIAGVLSAVVDAVKKVISWLDSRGQSTAGVTPADLAPYSAGVDAATAELACRSFFEIGAGVPGADDYRLTEFLCPPVALWPAFPGSGDPWAELEETSTPGAIPAAAEVSGMLQRLEVSGGRALWTLGGPHPLGGVVSPFWKSHAFSLANAGGYVPGSGMGAGNGSVYHDKIITGAGGMVFDTGQNYPQTEQAGPLLFGQIARFSSGLFYVDAVYALRLWKRYLHAWNVGLLQVSQDRYTGTAGRCDIVVGPRHGCSKATADAIRAYFRARFSADGSDPLQNAERSIPVVALRSLIRRQEKAIEFGSLPLYLKSSDPAFRRNLPLGQAWKNRKNRILALADSRNAAAVCGGGLDIELIRDAATLTSVQQLLKIGPYAGTPGPSPCAVFKMKQFSAPNPSWSTPAQPPGLQLDGPVMTAPGGLGGLALGGLALGGLALYLGGRRG